MKKRTSLIRLALVAVLLAQATGLCAQKNVEAAFASFKKEKAVKISESRSREADPASGSLIQRTDRIDFSFAADKNSLLDKLLSAFERDRDAAYDEFYHSGDGRRMQPILLGNEISVGTSKDANYVVMAFADKETAVDGNPVNRTAYAVEWQYTEDDKTIAGSLYVVYGSLPRKSSLKVVRSISRSNLPETLSSYSAQLDNVDWSKLEEVLGDRGAFIQRMMPGGTLNVDSLSGSLSGQSGMPFLYFFRKLSLGYQKALKQGKESTYYLTSLLDLCKKQHSAVSDDERQLCTDELQRLLEMTKAEFDRAVLQECMKFVGR